MKQTEIGLIPDDWKTVAIGDVAAIVGGGTPSTLVSSYWNGEIQWFTPAELNDSKKYVSKSLRTITKTGLQGSSARLLPKGTVLLTTRASIGITAILKNEACTNQGFQSLIAKENCYNEFLYYVIPLIKKEMMARASGSTFAEISAKKLSTITFSLPPLPEQQRIAKALSDVDAVISTTEKLIQKKKNIKQGTMQQLLTGKKRLPGFGEKQADLFVPNGTHTKKVKDVSPEQIRLSTKKKQTELGEIPEDWEVKSLGEMLKIGHGKDYKNLKSGNVPVYGTGGYMTSVNDFLYEGETVCIGRKGTIDKPQYHSGKIWTVDTLFYTYDFKSLNPKYLFYKFCLIDWLSMNEASGVPSLTAKNIEDIQITIPTEEEQTAIANVLSSMDKEIETLNTKLEKYRNLKTAMMQQLLTGKIRLGQGEINDR